MEEKCAGAHLQEQRRRAELQQLQRNKVDEPHKEVKGKSRLRTKVSVCEQHYGLMLKKSTTDAIRFEDVDREVQRRSGVFVDL